MYGSRIRQLIKNAEYGQNEFAKKIGVSSSTISFWCNAEYPPLEAIIKVCNELKIPLHDFFATDEEVKKCDNCIYYELFNNKQQLIKSFRDIAITCSKWLEEIGK